MNINFVAGFLGSGKTTAIMNASKMLIKNSKHVGVITNDQGKYQVDKFFMESNDIPSTEVSNGCFCCRYDDFDAHLLALANEYKPNVIFAESVGSCTDILATVVKPFVEFREKYVEKATLSTFTDIRLLERKLKNMVLPFSEKVMYIFEKQIEEADILVINKKDLYDKEKTEEVIKLAKEKYSDKHIITMSTFEEADIKNWLNELEKIALNMNRPSLKIDYKKYGEGEQVLAWLDEVICIRSNENSLEDVVTVLISSFIRKIKAKGLSIGHVKFFVNNVGLKEKFSVVSADENIELISLDKLSGDSVGIILNARVETKPDVLKELIEESIKETMERYGVIIEEKEEAYFSPGMPEPVHRFF